MPLNIGTRLGPYEILAPLGAGGMGEVYWARDPKLKRDVALKVLPEAFASDPERMARFQREAEVLASLNHPNIAAIYGVEDRALVMELVEGESPSGPMEFDDAWKIASQIAAGLEYAHERNIVGDAVTVAPQVLVNGGYSVSESGALVYATGSDGQASQLTWYERQGKLLGGDAPPGSYIEISLSPDGQKAASVQYVDYADIWIFDFARKVNTRLTSNQAANVQPIWSADGKSVVYYSRRNPSGLYLKAADGTGDEALLLQMAGTGAPRDWSHDGGFLLYEQAAAKTKNDLWVMPIETNRKSGEPKPYLNSQFDEREGKFSPDGRFVAYVSDESGKFEVYVSTFPDPKSGRWAISCGGGYQPRWRRDGKELLYFSGEGKLMSVDVTLTPGFRTGVPKLLFQAPITGGGATANQHRWDLTPDGRFLINTAPGSAAMPLTVVLNWQAGLRK